MNAPERCVSLVETAVNLPFTEGIKQERKLILEAMGDPQAKALQHVFFAERLANKVPGLPRDMALKSVKSVGIIGAGTMGGGIGMSFINNGIPVTILELDKEALQKGLGVIQKNYDS